MKESLTRLLALTLVFLTLFGTYAFFWHARDWNISSRLMLTYALGDRGTLVIDGLEDHTRDRARIDRHYYSDKAPGFSLSAVPAYLGARALLGLPAHPLHLKGDGFTHWPADYWVTLGTSALLTALAGAWLTAWSRALGCTWTASALVGLTYGLATPANIYATLSYGHQVAAFCHLAAFSLLWNLPDKSPRRANLLAAMAGLLTSWGSVVELQTGVLSALLSGYLLALLVGKKVRLNALFAFAAGALLPALVLAFYNYAAFGSPLTLGYFHEDIQQFRDVHSAENPLGLRSPDFSRALPLLWGRYRGLLCYAPIVALAVPGWLLLAQKRYLGLAIVTLTACLAVYCVNLSYPEWTGGWSTGPRLLTPLLPFAMLAVAGFLSIRRTLAMFLATLLALAGAIAMLLFQGVGGRLSQDLLDPWTQVVLPTWTGRDTPFARGGVFDRNLVSTLFPDWVASLSPGEAWQQFLPLLAFQAAMLVLTFLICRFADRPPPHTPEPSEHSNDLAASTSDDS